MNRDKTVYLRHIADAIGRIEEYTREIGEQTFRDSTLIQDGVIRQLEIIGEAVKQLPESFCCQYSHIPWEDIAGTRDMLIHHYFGVSLDEVWMTVQRDIPVLRAEIVKILKLESKNP